MFGDGPAYWMTRPMASPILKPARHPTHTLSKTQVIHPDADGTTHTRILSVSFLLVPGEDMHRHRCMSSCPYLSEEAQKTPRPVTGDEAGVHPRFNRSPRLRRIPHGGVPGRSHPSSAGGRGGCRPGSNSRTGARGVPARIAGPHHCPGGALRSCVGWCGD